MSKKPSTKKIPAKKGWLQRAGDLIVHLLDSFLPDPKSRKTWPVVTIRTVAGGGGGGSSTTASGSNGYAELKDVVVVASGQGAPGSAPSPWIPASEHTRRFKELQLLNQLEKFIRSVAAAGQMRTGAFKDPTIYPRDGARLVARAKELVRAIDVATPCAGHKIGQRCRSLDLLLDIPKPAKKSCRGCRARMAVRP